MADYPHYTTCVLPQDYHRPTTEAAAYGLLVGIIATIGTALTTGIGWLLVLPALLAAMTALLSFVDWWLHGRLICLGGERCVIGMVVSVDKALGKGGFSWYDTDYCFNLLLPMCNIGADQNTVETSAYQGELIKKQAVVPLPLQGYTAKDCPTDPATATAVLHCEIEGAGMQRMYDLLSSAIAFLSVATVASWFCLVPVIGWIACAIAVFAGAVWLYFFLQALATEGPAVYPSDVNPELGSTLHVNECTGQGADILVVVGEWVYDSLHEGWNEIHPVRRAQKICTWKGQWPFNNVQDELNVWCTALANADSAHTKENQQKPENQWQIHPEIDGCEPAPIIE
jgi:hypothetical protein